MEKHGIKYHEIHFGKPWAQFYVDDKAVNCLDNVPKEIGYYPPVAEKKESQMVLESKKSAVSNGSNGDSPMNLIIPLGGIGSRFQKHGYTQPKVTIEENHLIFSMEIQIQIISHHILGNFFSLALTMN